MRCRSGVRLRLLRTGLGLRLLGGDARFRGMGDGGLRRYRSCTGLLNRLRGDGERLRGDGLLLSGEFLRRFRGDGLLLRRPRGENDLLRDLEPLLLLDPPPGGAFLPRPASESLDSDSDVVECLR